MENSPKQRIGIFTGGGTAPGWNSVIGGAVQHLHETGNEVVGIRDGWKGLLEVNDLVDFGGDFSRQRMMGLLRKGGTEIGSSRTKINKEQYEKVWETMNRYELDGAIAVGGDDTLIQAGEITKAAQESELDLPGFVGVPKTVDDDVGGTEKTFGFQTAVHDAARQIRRIRKDAQAQHRVAGVEVMGRNCGRMTLHAGFIGGADIILIPEFPFDGEVLLNKIKEVYEGQGFVVVAISEGFSEGGEKDAFGHAKKKDAARDFLKFVKDSTGINTMEQVVGYDARAGAPIASDAIFAAEMGATAGYLADQKMYGNMVTLRNGRITHAPLTDVSGGRHVTLLEYDPETMLKRNLPPNIVFEMINARGDLDKILRGQEEPKLPT